MRSRANRSVCAHHHARKRVLVTWDTGPYSHIRADGCQTKRRRKKEEEDKLAFGTYAGNSTFTYRVRKASAYGGYKIVTQVRLPWRAVLASAEPHVRGLFRRKWMLAVKA